MPGFGFTGALRLQSTFLPEAAPSVDYWAARCRFGTIASIYAGSLRFAGTLARARNPLMSVGEYFHTPPSPSQASIFALGTGTNPRYTAFECNLGAWQVAACAAPEALLPSLSSATDFPASPLWAQVSHYNASDSGTSENQTTVFCGYGQAPQPDDEAWLLDIPRYPNEGLLFPGIEQTFRIDRLSGEILWIGNISRFRKPDSALRAQIALTIGDLTLSAGTYGSGFTFADLDGQRASVYNRTYLEGLMIIPIAQTEQSTTKGNSRLKAQAAQVRIEPFLSLWTDCPRPDKWYETGQRQYGALARLRLITAAFVLSASGVWKSETLGVCVEAKGSLPNGLLSVETSAKRLVYPEPATECQLKCLFTPTSSLCITTKAEAAWKTDITLDSGVLSTELAGRFKFRKIQLIPKAEITANLIDSEFTGNIALKVIYY